jgi:hypothetical protein
MWFIDLCKQKNGWLIKRRHLNTIDMRKVESRMTTRFNWQRRLYNDALCSLIVRSCLLIRGLTTNINEKKKHSHFRHIHFFFLSLSFSSRTSHIYIYIYIYTLRLNKDDEKQLLYTVETCNYYMSVQIMTLSFIFFFFLNTQTFLLRHFFFFLWL